MKKFAEALAVNKAIETIFKVEARQILIFIVTPYRFHYRWYPEPIETQVTYRKKNIKRPFRALHIDRHIYIIYVDP